MRSMRLSGAELALRDETSLVAFPAGQLAGSPPKPSVAVDMAPQAASVQARPLRRATAHKLRTETAAPANSRRYPHTPLDSTKG